MLYLHQKISSGYSTESTRRVEAVNRIASRSGTKIYPVNRNAVRVGNLREILVQGALTNGLSNGKSFITHLIIS